MALGTVANAGNFVREMLYRYRFKWANPGSIASAMVDPTDHLLPLEDSMYDCRLIGYSNHYSSDIYSIQQNSLGWALGIPEKINPNFYSGKIITNSKVSIQNWLEYIVAQTDTYGKNRNPIIYKKDYDVLPARLVDYKNIQIMDDVTDQWANYIPQQYDIALFFDEDAPQSQTRLKHASLCFNVNEPYHYLDKDEILKWTSKLADGPLVEHHLGLLSKSHNTTAEYALDIGNASDKLIQGNLEFIIKKR
jgi:hypothetical protein